MNLILTVLFPDMDNLINLIDIPSPARTSNKQSNFTERPSLNFSSTATNQDERLKGVYVSENVLNLSKRALTEAEVSLLSKGLKFVPTPNFVDKAAIKQDLE